VMIYYFLIINNFMLMESTNMFLEVLTMSRLVLSLIVGLVLACSSTGWASFTQTEGLIAYWSFDNPSDPGHDDSGNGEDGTVYGATSTSGKVSNALSFDGVDDWVDIPDDISPEYITLAAWIYPTGVYDIGDHGSPIITKETGAGVPPWSDSFAWRLRITPYTHKLQLQCFTSTGVGGGSVISDEELEMGKWYHVAGTYDGINTRVYINENLEGSYNAPISEPLVTSTLPTGIGHLPNWSVQWFDGIIDEVRIYDRALVPGPIEAMVDIDPDTLNLNSKGKWITCYIELPEGYDVDDIDVSTIKLNDQVPAESHPTGIGDEDDDGVPDLMVKFDREAVQEILQAGDEVEITVTGELEDETPFEGSDTIRVIDKGGKK
jgi:hypothetical protein